MEAGVVGCGMIRALRRTGRSTGAEGGPAQISRRRCRGWYSGGPRCAGESGQGRGFFPLPAGGPAGAVGQLRKKRVGGVKGWAGCRDNTGQAPADARVSSGGERSEGSRRSETTQWAGARAGAGLRGGLAQMGRHRETGRRRMKRRARGAGGKGGADASLPCRWAERGHPVSRPGQVRVLGRAGPGAPANAWGQDKPER